jgi:hypothetical protein
MTRNDAAERIIGALIGFFVALGGFSLNNLLDDPIPGAGFASFAVAVLLFLRFLTGCANHLWFEHIRPDREEQRDPELRLFLDLAFLTFVGMAAASMCYSPDASGFFHVAMMMPAGGLLWHFFHWAPSYVRWRLALAKAASTRDRAAEADRVITSAPSPAKSAARRAALQAWRSAERAEEKLRQASGALTDPWRFWWPINLAHTALFAVALYLERQTGGAGPGAWSLPLPWSWSVALLACLSILLWDVTKQLKMLRKAPDRPAALDRQSAGGDTRLRSVPRLTGI